MKSRLTDPTYLLVQQYRTAGNLQARMALHERFGMAQDNWFHWLFDHLELPDDAEVLELGCGTGQLWRENLDRIPAGWRITVSDRSEGMLAEAQRNLAGSAGRFSWETVDAQEIPRPAAALDAVIANHMLYHVPDRPRALGEIKRVLRPGAKLYAATNGLAHMRAIVELIERFAPHAASWGGSRPEEAFGLESGQEQLAAVFTEVRVFRRPNELVVTEPEPLVAYILSLTAGAELSDEAIAALDAEVRRRIADSGAVRMMSDGGLLVAW